MNRRSPLAGLRYLLWLIPLALTALLFWGGFRAKNTELLFPHQRLRGLELGNLTVEDAVAALQAAGVGAGNDFSVTVSYPDGYSFTVTAAEAGLAQDAEAEAEVLYRYGRSGDLRRDLWDWLSSLLTARVVEWEEPELDTDALRAAAQRAAAETDSAMTPSAWAASDTELCWTRGCAGQTTDVSELTRLLTQAFLLKKSSFTYEPLRQEPDAPDFAAIRQQVAYPCRDAAYDADWNVIPEENGLDFDAEAAEAMAGETDYGETMTVPLVILYPEVTAEDLRKVQYADLLASYTTELVGTDVRQQNIRLAAESMNGCIVEPGAVFSFNEVVGQRTEERGFGAAPAYLGGQVVMEVGGGICQVSSTLYNAVLLADLEITYRTCHRYAQTYVPYGMDATVSWGGPDFQFTNSTTEPLRVDASCEDGRLTIELWGTRRWDGYIVMSYEIEQTIPPTEVEQVDASLAPGTRKVSDWGREGMVVQTYRSRYQADGTLIETVPEDRSEYASKNKIVLVGPET